jgi:hypothetical protein
LDGAPHPLKNEAITAVNADRMANPLEEPLELQLEEPVKSGKLEKLLERDPFSPEELRRFARRKGAKTGWWGRK